MVGVASPLGGVAPAGTRGGPTMVGMPSQLHETIVASGPPPSIAAAPAGPASSARAERGGGRTIIGHSGPDAIGRAAPIPKLTPEAKDERPAGPTLLGVARPGIAPSVLSDDAATIEMPGRSARAAVAAASSSRAPSSPAPSSRAPSASPETPRGASRAEPRTIGRDPARDPARDAARELGATVVPAPDPARVRELENALRRRFILPAHPAKGSKKKKPAKRPEDIRARRALGLVIAGGVLALVAVLVAVLWPSPPPILARARADGGHEGVELTCKSCPDGTKLSLLGASAVTSAGLAVIPLATPLAVGENRLKVSIDRPGDGRDETVSVVLNVGYRIRPELGTLQAERPSFQIVAEVASTTKVSIDGHPMALAAGRGTENVDVTDDCTGLSADVKTLTRQIPYVVTPESGPPEQGVVNVAVGIVPLRLDAPVALAAPAGSAASTTAGGARGGLAPHVVTDGPSFVLAGSTLKGAEVFAAGRPITVHPDGTFAQVMNVSSVGATQIEVRAKMPGMAPRLTQIRVRRVESLDKAARDFATTDPPVPFADVLANVAGAVGKPVAFSGELSEVKKQSYDTVMLLDVSAASGCAGADVCTVRLVQAGEPSVKRGDVVRVFGHVARPFATKVEGQGAIAEIEVDFLLKSDGKDRR